MTDADPPGPLSRSFAKAAGCGVDPDRPGFATHLPRHPLVIDLPPSPEAARHLQERGIVLTGAIGSGCRLVLDGEQRQRYQVSIELFGHDEQTICLFASGVLQAHLRLEQHGQWIVIGATPWPLHFQRIVVRGRDSGVLLADGCSCNGATLTVHGDATAIALGQDCMLSHGVEIAASDEHSIFGLDDLAWLNPPRTVIVGPHVWLGANSSVLKGVGIGAGAILGTRSVASRDLPPRCAAIGMPARVVRENVTWSRHLAPDEAQRAAERTRLDSWLASPD
jgi:acetyltransferase-like isoleucine patch superfamily enzyme